MVRINNPEHRKQSSFIVNVLLGCTALLSGSLAMCVWLHTLHFLDFALSGLRLDFLDFLDFLDSAHSGLVFFQAPVSRVPVLQKQGIKFPANFT